MKELTLKEYDELWWDWWPYSEVEIIEQQRIFDDRPARKYLQVKFFINPTTYRLCKKNLDKFSNPFIAWIYDRAKLRRWYWYEWIIYTSQYYEEKIRDEANEHKELVQKAIIEMHNFVSKNFLN